MTMNAPVGPPMATRVPPNPEIRNPAMTAVKSPASGFTPEAIANAIASGNATIPTVMPDTRSAEKSLEVYPFKVSNNLGRNGIFSLVMRIRRARSYQGNPSRQADAAQNLEHVGRIAGRE